jgi:hypothetical protein
MSVNTEIIPPVIPRVQLTTDNATTKIKSFSKLGGLCYFQCHISPELATTLLKLEKRNRDRRPGIVKKYSEYMVKGKWKLCPDPIMFDVNGELSDGAHSLNSVQVSKVSSPFVICCGVEPESKKVIDEVATRTAVDVLQYDGKLNGQVKSIHSSIMKSMIVESPASLRVTIPKLELSELLERNFQIINKIVLLVGNSKLVKFIRQAPVLAPVTRAYSIYRGDVKKVKRIERFLGILTGDIRVLSAEDDVAYKLREWLLTNLSNKKSRPFTRVIYKKTAHALWMYLTGRQCKWLTEAKVEYFPVDFGGGSKAYFDYQKRLVRKHGGKRLTSK